MSVPDANWCEFHPKEAAREIENLMISRDRLHTALSEVVDLIDEGKLVRSTAGDSTPNWASESLPLVMTLKKAMQALGRIET